MSSFTRRGFLLSLTVPMAITACAKGSPSEQAATKFMDAYYVRMSLKEAANLTEGLAADKIAAQTQLLDGQTITNPSTIPTVDFYLVKKEAAESPDEAGFIYEVKSKAEDIGPRQVFVKLRSVNGVWKVTQFKEEVQAPKP